MNLKEVRKSHGITQIEASVITGVPLRTYKNYENDPNKEGNIKYEHIMRLIQEYFLVDEEHGYRTIEEIKEICKEVFERYDIKYCYLFGSYATNTPRENSDIDLLISDFSKNMMFLALIEELRQKLAKKIDLLTIKYLVDNEELLNEILEKGVKIYDGRKR